MGCPFSIETRDSITYKAHKPAATSHPLQFSSQRSSTMCSLGATILIQKWYRRHRARLEARRRCAWMIYQSLEYAGEQDHLKLYQLYNDLIMNADNTNQSTKSPQRTLKDQRLNNCSTHPDPAANRNKCEDIWKANMLPPITSSYQGPQLRFPLDMSQVNEMMSTLSKPKRYHARYIHQLLNEARQVLSARPNVQRISTSISKQITVVGDLHGQYIDLCTILHKNGMPDVTNPYIFNGDFVDRGRQSLETFVLILALMLIRPTAVFLNRGNHEDHYINCQYGFIKELQKKYKSSASLLVKCFSEIYTYLPLATIIDNQIFVCHGGISDKTDVNILDNLDRTSFRTFVKLPNKGYTDLEAKTQFQDLLWSDPIPQPGISKNDQRGIGCFYGSNISQEFLTRHGFKLLIRSHECKPEGFEWTHQNRVLTIFSASNYYTEGSNKGAYCRILSDGTVHPFQFIVSGGKKQKTLRQSVNSAEEMALTDLKNKITTHSVELRNEFIIADPQQTGKITLKKWCQVMEKVLNLKLPWRTLQPRLCKMDVGTYQVEYETTFQKLNVSHTVANAPPSVTEELYKNRDILEGIFRAIDKDNSGHLSLEEFTTACLRLPNRTMLDESSIANMARSIDMNKDGQIDFNEFLEAFRLAESDHDRLLKDESDLDVDAE